MSIIVLDHLWEQICWQELLKIAQSGHTGRKKKKVVGGEDEG